MDLRYMFDGITEEEITHTIQNFFQNQGIDLNKLYNPSIDIVENDEFITVYVDASGVLSNDIDIDFLNNKIQITYERQKPYDSDVKKLKSEVMYGKFNRNITIPINVYDKNSVKTHLKNGVLQIIIDKKNELQNKFSIRLEEE